MELHELAALVETYLNDGVDCDIRYTHGIELMPGFFNLYDEKCGQSKTALLHLESGYVFKRSYGNEKWTVSGSYLGEVNIEGVDYRVRIPHFYLFNGIAAQEYINGEKHDCNGSFSCKHTSAMARETGYFDCHTGNWKIVGDEIVLFDFD